MKLKKFLLVLLIALASFLAFGCGNNDSEDTSKLDLEKANELVEKLAITFAEGDSATAVTKNITLGTISMEGATLTWASSHPAISTSGVVTRPAAGSEDLTVVLTANVKVGDQKVSKTFTLIVKAEEVVVTPATPISEILTKAVDSEVKAKGTVIGTYARGFMLKDDTGVILAYVTADVKVGDFVEVEGKITSYKDRNQFGAESEVTKVEDGKAYTLTSSSLTLENFDTVKAGEYSQLVEAVVTVSSKSASYVNTLFVGSTDKGIAVTYPADADSYEVGKTYKLTGLTMYASTYGGVESMYLMVLSHEEFGYTVTFDTDGGDAIEALAFVDPTSVELPTPVKEGSTFLGWFDGETKVEAITEAKNYTLKAKWHDSVLVVDAADATKYATLQAALADAQEGDTIMLAAGTYGSGTYTTDVVEVTVNNLTIKGAASYKLSHADTFEADATKDSILDLVLVLKAENLTVSNVVIKGRVALNGATGLATIKDSVTTAVSIDESDNSIDGPIAVLGESEDLLVDNVVVADKSWRFVYVQAAVRNVTVNGCTVLDSATSLYDFLRFGAGNTAVVSGDVVMSNNYLHALQAGYMLRVPSGKTHTIINNHFVDVHAAIWFRNGTVPEEGYNVTITGNVFDKCGNSDEDWDVIAVTVSDATKVDIHFNMFMNSLVRGGKNSDYTVKMRKLLGDIDCSNNWFATPEELSYVSNATNVDKVATKVTATVFGTGSADTTPNTSYWNSDAQKTQLWLVSKEAAHTADAIDDAYSYAYRACFNYSETMGVYVVEARMTTNGSENISVSTSDYILMYNGNSEIKETLDKIVVGSQLYPMADLSGLTEGVIAVDFLVADPVFALTLVDGEESNVVFYGNFANVELPVLTKEGYTFLGWFDGDNKVETLTENANLTLTAKWHATTLFVDASDETKYATLEAAVADALEGDTIVLAAGEYGAVDQKIEINVKGLTITSEKVYNLTHTDEFTADSTVDAVVLSVIRVLADDFTISNVVVGKQVSMGSVKNVKIDGIVLTSASNEPLSGTVDDAPENVVVNRVYVAGQAARTVYFYGTITNLTVSNCVVLDQVTGLYDFIRIGNSNDVQGKGEFIVTGNYVKCVQTVIHDRFPRADHWLVADNYFVSCPGVVYFRSIAGVTDNVTYDVLRNVCVECGSAGWDVLYFGTNATTKVNVKYNSFIDNKNDTSEGCWVIMALTDDGTYDISGNYFNVEEQKAWVKNVTLTDPLTAQQAYTAAKALTKNTYGDVVTVAGKVLSASYNASYQSYTLVLAGEDGKTFTVYSSTLASEAVTVPHQNDFIIATGSLYNYNDSTMELSGSSDVAYPEVQLVVIGESTVTVTAEGGQATEVDATALNGTELTVYVEADEGNVIIAVTANGEVLEADEDGGYTFTVKGDTVVNAFCAPAGTKVAQLKYTGTSNGVAKADENNAATLNLDAEVFTVTYDKNGASSDLALRTDGIRMYATKQSTKGNKLTVSIASGKKIDKVIIAFDEGYSATAKVYAGETLLTANEDGSYTINGSSFTIFNDNSEVTSNTQVRFQSIEIRYSDAQ